MDGAKEGTADGGWTRRGPGPSAHRTSTTGLSQGGVRHRRPSPMGLIREKRTPALLSTNCRSSGPTPRGARRPGGSRAGTSGLSVLHVVDGGINEQAGLGGAFRRLAFVTVEP